MPNKIKRLIDAASNAGLIHSVNTSEGGKYCSFVMDEHKYELCLEGDPDLRTHPKAERALRASDAIMDLFSKIDHSYNCFAVSMASINAPRPATLRKMIRVPDSVTISDPLEQPQKNYSGITHMLEVVIDVFLGNDENGTVVDRVLAEKVDDGFIFRSASSDEFSYDADVLSTFDAEQAGEGARSLLEGLGVNNAVFGDGIGETYGKIISALAADENSEFTRYIKSVQEKRRGRADQPTHGSNVGRIELRISSLYVGAERVKRFVYTLTQNADNGQPDGEPLEFILDWGKGSSSSAKPELYLLIENGEYVGMTSIPPKDKNGNVNESLRVPPRERLKYSRIPRCGDDGVVSLVNSFVPSEAYKNRWHQCQWCQTGYFADDDIHTRYKMQFSVLDYSNVEQYGCESCFTEGFTKGGYAYRSGIKTANGNGEGSLFAKVKDNGELLSLAEGGNVFICASCQEPVYKNIKNLPQCEICKGYLCKTCDIKRVRTIYKDSSGEHTLLVCSRCAKAPRVHYQGKSLKVYKAYYPDESKAVSVLETADISNAALLEKCYGCGKLIYTDGLKDKCRCERCGAFATSKCHSVSKSSVYGTHICGECIDDMGKDRKAHNDYMDYLGHKLTDELDSTCEKAIKRYISSRQYIGELKEKFEDEFITYMRPSDRKKYLELSMGVRANSWEIERVKSTDDARGILPFTVKFVVCFVTERGSYLFTVSANARIRAGRLPMVEIDTRKVAYRGQGSPSLYIAASGYIHGGLYKC